MNKVSTPQSAREYNRMQSAYKLAKAERDFYHKHLMDRNEEVDALRKMIAEMQEELDAKK